MFMMMRLIIISLLIAVFALSVQAQPKLEIPDSKFYFGHMPQHSTVTQYFWFKSVGTDTVKISKIVTGCTCVFTPLESYDIPPGDSVKVGFSWDIKNSIYNTGKFPYIYNNTEDNPHRIHLTGVAVKTLDSLRPFTCIPYKFELSKIEDKSIDELEFELINYSDSTIKLFEMSFPVEQCEVVIPSEIPPSSSVKGTIKVKPEYLDKEFNSSITIAAGNWYKKRITIPIRRKFY